MRSVNLKVIYNTKKVSYFVSNKDKIPDLYREAILYSYHSYQFTCPGCSLKIYRQNRQMSFSHASVNTASLLNTPIPTTVALHNIYPIVNTLITSLTWTIYILIFTIWHVTIPHKHLIPILIQWLQILSLTLKFFTHPCRSYSPKYTSLSWGIVHKVYNNPELNTGLKAFKELSN